MSEQPRKSAPFRTALCALALPLLLSQCGHTGDDEAAPNAGASAAATQSGAAGALGGAGGAGGTSAAGSGSADGGAPLDDGGAAGATPSGGTGGNAAAGSPATDAGASGASGALGAAGSAECDVELTSYSSPSAQHVEMCSVINYPMNPPVYGDHYPVWAAYGSYPFPVPLGSLVHNLEHGAIVLLYNCPAGCAAEVASAQAFINALPQDPRCTTAVKHQLILSPDPSLPTRWAAVAWGHSLLAECLDVPAFRAFYDAHVAQGPEDICADGADLAANTCQ